jgi:hypothetical protein
LVAVAFFTMAAALLVSADTATNRRSSLEAAECPHYPAPIGRSRPEPEFRRLDGRQLVPGMPAELLACFYRAADDGTGGLRAAVPVARRDIARIVDATRAPFTPGDHGCPSKAFNHQLMLISRYPDASQLAISIRYRCGLASNGTLVGSFGSRSAESALLAMLHRG